MNYNVLPKNKECRSLIEQVLFNRGLTFAEIEQYLEPEAKVCHNPDFLDNIGLAAKELIKAILRQDHIHIQIDSDCDGYTSSAVLLNYLHRVFPATVENCFSYSLHDSKAHGIAIESIPANTKMVIVPDASSDEYDIHKQLNERGIIVIVLDHHSAEKKADDPAIIVNNQMCDYPNKALSGVGIVYKFCLVLDKILKVSYADDYLDLVALGLIADMMDVRPLETRYYICEGLRELRSPFFKAMAEKNEFKIKGEYNSFTVGWYIAPFINAMARSGTLEQKQMFFKSLLEYETFKLVPSTKKGEKGQEETILTQAVRTCGNVKRNQDAQKTAMLPIIHDYIVKNNLLSEPILIIKLEEAIDHNLNGLIANQVMSEYRRPVLILTKRQNPDLNMETWEGSARGFAVNEVDDWRKFILDSGYAIYAAGHPMAFGVGFTPDKLEEFRKYCWHRFSAASLDPVYKVDFAWSSKDNFDGDIITLGESKHLWGKELEEPMIALVNVNLTADKIQLLGKGTLKITIPHSKTTCIKFGFGEERYEQLMNYFTPNVSSIQMTIIGHCQINDFMGYNPQIEIKDFSVAPLLKIWDF